MISYSTSKQNTLNNYIETDKTQSKTLDYDSTAIIETESGSRP